MPRYEIMIFWDKTVHLSAKIFRIDLWSFRRIVFLQVTLHMQILSVLQPQFLRRIHIRQKFFLPSIKRQSPENFMFLLPNTIFSVKYFSGSVNHFLFQRSNHGTLINSGHTLHRMLKLLLLKKFMKILIIKLKLSMIKQLIFKVFWTHQTNWRVNWTLSSFFSELLDIELLGKLVHRYQAAFFWCANLQTSLKAMQHSSKQLKSDATILKQVFATNVPSKNGH